MDLWNTETPIRDIEGLEIEIPAWVAQDISPSDVAAIIQGGCASGAYTPAVTYHTAAATMAEHGDEVLQFIEDYMDELPQPKKSESWSGLAVFYLSVAVELWASGIESRLEAYDPDSYTMRDKLREETANTGDC